MIAWIWRLISSAELFKVSVCHLCSLQVERLYCCFPILTSLQPPLKDYGQQTACAVWSEERGNGLTFLMLPICSAGSLVLPPPSSPPQIPALLEHRCHSLVVHCSRTHTGALSYSNPGKQKPPHSTSPLHTSTHYRGISTATRQPCIHTVTSEVLQSQLIKFLSITAVQEFHIYPSSLSNSFHPGTSVKMLLEPRHEYQKQLKVGFRQKRRHSSVKWLRSKLQQLPVL